MLCQIIGKHLLSIFKTDFQLTCIKRVFEIEIEFQLLQQLSDNKVK